MAIASKPLHRPTLSSLTLARDRASPLLGREITLYFSGEDGSVNEVIATVGEIYQRCKKTLSEAFGPTRLIIGGSSVTHLFSKEPIGDIDIHATVDVTHLPETDRVGKGFALKWAVLKGISEIISEKLAVGAMEKKTLKPSTENILFKEVNTLIGSRSDAPFNVHTIRLGNIPVEFSMFNVIKPVVEQARNYDFNSGSLELCIEDSGEITIHSSRKDIGVLIDEVSRRELTCVDQEEITRKGICRYLAKLALSGYYDKDKELLVVMLESLKKRNEGKEDETLAKDIIEEILDHFRDKGIDPSAALLSLWLIPKPNPFLKVLIAEATERLKATLLMDPITQLEALSTLVQKGKKAECCWYLLMQAKSARKVLHRGEESLQLEIPAYPMFASTPSDVSVFIIAPISGLAKFSESDIPQGFLDLQQHELQIQVEGDETKVLLQKLAQDVLIKPCLYPVLSTAIRRFGIETGADFSNLFIEWVEGLSEPEKQRIPLQALMKALENIKEGQGIKQSTILSLLKMLHKLVGKEKICSFESLPMQKIITFYTQFFLKRENWEALSSEDRGVILDFANAHVEELCKKGKLEAYKKIGEEALCSRTLNILYILYAKKHAGVSEGILGARLCLELGYPSHSVKFLQTLAISEAPLDGREIQALFEKLAEFHPLELATFLKENATVIKQKTADFSRIIEPFLEKLIAGKLSSELAALFVELIHAFCGEEERQKITKTLFISAANGNAQSIALLEEVCKSFTLSCRAFPWISEMDKDQLHFLSQQPGFTLLFASDPNFTMTIIDQAILLQNRDLVTSGSLHLARTDPDKCFLFLEALNSMRKDAADLSTLPASLKILAELLKAHSGLMTNASCKRLIEARLEDLSIYFASQEAGMRVLDEEFVLTLKGFHKQVALHTLESPCWPRLWQTPHALSTSKAIENWITPEDFATTLTATHPTGNILKLIDFFDIDGPFIYEFARQVSRLPEGLQPAFTPAIKLLLRKGSHALLAKFPKEPSLEAGAVAKFVNNLRGSIDTTDISEASQTIIEICSFYAAYCDRSEELKLLKYLNQLHKPGNETLRKQLESMTQPQKILFLIAQRAMERKDLSMIAQIKSYYIAWGRNKTPDEYFSPEEVHSQCMQWKAFLDGAFSDAAINKSLPCEALEFHAMEFYSLFLADTIKKRSVVPGSVLSPAEIKINGASFTRILEFINFLNKKKLIKSIPCISLLVDVAKNLEPEQLQDLVTRFIYMATNMLVEIQKQPIQQQDLKSFSYLLAFASKLLSYAEPSGKTVISREAIVKLLEVARSVFPYFNGEKHLLEDSASDISFLEGSLSKKDMLSYHLSWAESILKRKETVHFTEVSEWVALTCRLDPNLSKSFVKEGTENKFADKLIVTREYFDNPVVIRAFLEMIDLGFTRFYEHMETRETTDDILGLNVFTLLQIYYAHLGVGICNIQEKPGNKTEVLRLEKFYANILIKCLEVPKALCKSIAIQVLIERIFMKSKGQIVLIKRPGLTPAEDVNILYLIVRNLLLLTIEEYNSLDGIPEIVKELYKNDKKTIQEFLTPTQFEELEFVLCKLREASSAKAGGAASIIRKL